MPIARRKKDAKDPVIKRKLTDREMAMYKKALERDKKRKKEAELAKKEGPKLKAESIVVRIPRVESKFEKELDEYYKVLSEIKELCAEKKLGKHKNLYPPKHGFFPTDFYGNFTWYFVLNKRPDSEATAKMMRDILKKNSWAKNAIVEIGRQYTDGKLKTTDIYMVDGEIKKKQMIEYKKKCKEKEAKKWARK